jgi:hypothetical protein
MQTPSPQQLPHTNTYMKWDQVHEDTLVDILKRLQEDGVLPPYARQLSKITIMLNQRLFDGTVYNENQVDGKLKYLKNLYVHYLEFVRDKAGTGCGWDDELETVTGTSEQWEHIRVVSRITYACHFVIKYFYVLTTCFPFRADHLLIRHFRQRALTSITSFEMVHRRISTTCAPSLRGPQPLGSGGMQALNPPLAMMKIIMLTSTSLLRR